MIAESYNIMIKGSCQSDHYKFTIGDNVDMMPLNFVSINRIVFPKNIYQIETQFTMTIDTIPIIFYPGNISFAQIQDKIEIAMGIAYTAQEYLTNFSQDTGKLQIFKDDGTDLTLVVSDCDYFELFGNLQHVGHQWISSIMCNLQNSTLVVMRSNLVSSLVPQFSHNDVLYSFSLDSSLNYQFYQEANIDIIQNKQPLVRNRNFTVTFEDGNGDPIIFQNRSSFYICLTLFHYKIKFIDYALNSLQKLLNVYVYKNYKKEIQEDLDLEGVETEDQNQNVEMFMEQIKNKPMLPQQQSQDLL